MSVLWFYKTYDNELQECGNRTWDHAKRLLPMAVELVNNHHPEPDPDRAPFVLEDFLEDRSGVDEVWIQDADEFVRFVTTFESGLARGHGFRFYATLMSDLKQWASGIEEYVTPATS